MIVGAMTIDLAIPEARTLKDKRRVIHGLKQRLRNRFNVSVAEIAHLNTAKRCRIALVMVSNEARPLHAQLDRMVDLVRRTREAVLVDYNREML